MGQHTPPQWDTIGGVIHPSTETKRFRTPTTRNDKHPENPAKWRGPEQTKNNNIRNRELFAEFLYCFSRNLTWTLSVHVRYPKWSFAVHFRNLEWTLAVHFRNLTWTLAVHFRNFKWTLAVHISMHTGTARIHLRFLKWTARVHARFLNLIARVSNFWTELQESIWDFLSEQHSSSAVHATRGSLVSACSRKNEDIYIYIYLYI